MSGGALDLDALAALEQAATPGPWRQDPDNGYVVLAASDVPITDDEVLVAADAKVIVALRNAAPALIEAARVSRDERRAAEDLADRLDRVAAERDAARVEVAALRERVEALHYRCGPTGPNVTHPAGYCHSCVMEWPCETIAAFTTGADQ